MSRRTSKPAEEQFSLFAQPAEMAVEPQVPAQNAPNPIDTQEVFTATPSQTTQGVGETALKAVIIDEQPKKAYKPKNSGNWRRRNKAPAPKKVEVPEYINPDTRAYERGTPGRRWRDANYNDRLPALLQAAEMLVDENREAYEIWEDRSSRPEDKNGHPILNKYQKFQADVSKEFIREETERTGTRPDARDVQSYVGEKVYDLQRKAYAHQDALNNYEHFRRNYWSAWWNTIDPSQNLSNEDVMQMMSTNWYSNALKIEEAIKPGVYPFKPGTGVKYKALPGTGDEYRFDPVTREEYVANPLMGGVDKSPRSGPYKHIKNVHYEKPDYRKEPKVVTEENAQYTRESLLRQKAEYEKNVAELDQMKLSDTPAQPASMRHSQSVTIRNIVGEKPQLKRKYEVDSSGFKSRSDMKAIKKRRSMLSSRENTSVSLRRKYSKDRVAEKDLGESA